MNELITIINSFGIETIIGGGAISLLLIGFVGYKLFKKPTKNKRNVDSVYSTNDAYKESPFLPNETNTYTVQTEESFYNGTDEFADDISDKSTEELLSEALTHEKQNHKKVVESLLLFAYKNETHQKEKIRLNVIYKNYIAGKSTLETLLKKYPSFLSNTSFPSQQSTKTPTEETQKFTFNDLLPKDNNISSEEIKKKLDEAIFNNSNIDDLYVFTGAQVSDNQENIKEFDATTLFGEKETKKIVQDDIFTSIASNSENSSNITQEQNEFFSKLGDIGTMIHQESKQKDNTIIQQTKTNDVWVNLMIMNNKMTLKQTYVTLSSQYNSKDGIKELTNKLNSFTGKDTNDKQINWAIISIIPLIS